MKKKLLLALAAFLVLVGAVVAGVVTTISMQPDVVHVERTTTISAQADDVYPLIDDYHQFVKWSPWSGRDPNQVTEFSDPSSGVNAWYTWKGNDQVGKGKMTTTAVEPPQRVVQDLEFVEPWPSKAEVYLVISPVEDKVEVTWGFDQPADMMTKVMTIFMDMDVMLGPDFAAGLANLKQMAESRAAGRVEAERLAAEAKAAEAATAEPGG